MNIPNPKFICLYLISFLIVCSSAKDFENRKLVIRTIQHDFFDPAINTFPTTITPVTNPVITPVTNPVTTPGVITTIPPANPITVTPTPISFPPTTPTTTNPVTPQVPLTNPVTTPVSNPVTTYPTPTTGVPITTPVVGPPVITNAPAVPGQSWCVVKSGVQETSVQAALDYACGIGGADCSAIQQGSSCYNPSTLQNHASYAFNSYYQRNPVPTSCDFGGAAAITNVNPSSGTCIYTTSSTSTSTSTSPSTTSPITSSPITTNPTPTPTTSSSSGATPTGSGTPPIILNATNPAFGGTTNPAFGGTTNPASGGITGFADSPQTAIGSSISMSGELQPFINCIIIVTSIITGRIVLDI